MTATDEPMPVDPQEAQGIRDRAVAALADVTIYAIENSRQCQDWYERAVERLMEAGLIAGVPAKVTGQAKGRANAVRCHAAGHPLRVLRDSNGIPHRLICSCGAYESDVPHPAEMRRYKRLAKLVADLDRCRHGRHRCDMCIDCPGGLSAGNPFLPAPGSQVGFDRAGEPYYVPSGDRPDPLCSTSEPDAWRRQA